MPKSSPAKQRFVPGTSRATRSRHTLLLQMAKDAEKLAAQAQRIGELRAARRVTQPDVADAVGVTLRAYQAWEAGDSGVGPQNIKKLAEYFGTTPDYLEYGTERERLPAPALVDHLGVQDRLARMEGLLNEIREMLLDAEVVRLGTAGTKQTAPPSPPARRKRAA